MSEDSSGARHFSGAPEGSRPSVEGDLVRPLGGVGVGERGVTNRDLVTGLESRVGRKSGGVEPALPAVVGRPVGSGEVV
eukprot:6659387-Pyramimonas_sp.AAC.1